MENVLFKGGDEKSKNQKSKTKGAK